MKKWMFLIFPGILFLVFLFFYHQNTAVLAEQERVHTEQAARQKADDAARKLMIENKAREDTELRAKEQADEEARKDAEKTAARKADRAKIQQETDTDQALVDKYTKEAEDLQTKFDSLTKQVAEESRAEFDLAKNVERARINRQDAQLQIDRMIEMVAERAERSSLTHPAIAAPRPQ